jgi:TATA-box binding protein (TBP) (component of TFIID and TFIIIB)
MTVPSNKFVITGSKPATNDDTKQAIGELKLTFNKFTIDLKRSIRMAIVIQTMVYAFFIYLFYFALK